MRRDLQKGFTLIEILVVLLIIGVVVSFAIPIYRHVMMQSRFNTLMSLAKSIADAQETYYLHNGAYAPTQDVLDVSYTEDKEHITFAFGDDEDFSFTLASRTDVPNVYYVIYQNHSANFTSNVHCEAKNDDEDAMWLCQEGLDGTKLDHASLLGEGYTAFLLSGEAGNGYVATTYNGTPNVTLSRGDSCVAGQDGGCDGVSASLESSCVVTGAGGGCNDSTFSGGSSCETQQGTGAGCQGSTFTDNSVCDSQSASSCSQSTFSYSRCYAAGGSNSCGDGSLFTNHSTCYGTSSANDRPHTSCGNSTYIDSTCYNTATQGYVCGASSYSNSVCYGNKYGGCGGNSTYTNGSICYGDGSTACNKSTYTTGSVCKANVKGACSNSTFKEGAYCEGAYCPVNSPKKDGTKWKACPDDNTGKTC